MKKIIALIVTFSPVVAFAQTSAIIDANSLSNRLIGLGNMFTYLLIALAVIFIIWNIVMYFIKGSSDETARSKAGQSILWGIVGLFVILSIWGLVNILMNTFRTTAPTNSIPQVQNVNNGAIPTVN